MAQTYPYPSYFAPTRKDFMHPIAFGQTQTFKGSFIWPEFDLEEEARTNLENDILLAKLNARLATLKKTVAVGEED
ncbi:MAG: hypothetical protein JO026_02760 [Patescibacteria group bacterium]|nr:hypothetical protein [Patescibacteria group bacterium]